jgi:hypothetical protein
MIMLRATEARKRGHATLPGTPGHSRALLRVLLRSEGLTRTLEQDHEDNGEEELYLVREAVGK